MQGSGVNEGTWRLVCMHLVFRQAPMPGQDVLAGIAERDGSVQLSHRAHPMPWRLCASSLVLAC
jgi:hypothetical protein